MHIFSDVMNIGNMVHIDGDTLLLQCALCSIVWPAFSKLWATFKDVLIVEHHQCTFFEKISIFHIDVVNDTLTLAM